MTRKEIKKRIARKLLYGDLDEIHVETFDLDSALNENKITKYSHVINIDPSKNYVNDSASIERKMDGDYRWNIDGYYVIPNNDAIMPISVLFKDNKLKGFGSHYIDDFKDYHICTFSDIDDNLDLEIKPNQSLIVIYPNTVSTPIIVIDDNKELNVPDLGNCIKYMYAEEYEFNSLNYKINVKNKYEEHRDIKTITAEQKSKIMMTVTSIQRETKKYDEDGKLIYYSNPVTKISCKLEGDILRTYYDGNVIYEYNINENIDEFVEHVKEVTKEKGTDMYVKSYKYSPLICVFTESEDEKGKVVTSTYMDGEKIIAKVRSTIVDDVSKIQYEDCSGIKYENIIIIEKGGYHDIIYLQYHDIDYDIVLSNDKIISFNSPYLFQDIDRLYVRNTLGIPEHYIGNLDNNSK